MSHYRVVTISNRHPQEYYYTYQYLQKSVRDQEILTLGQGLGNFSLSDKPRILHEAISEGAIPEEIIVFVDAWDVVFAYGSDEVVKRFLDFNVPVIIGAEKNCFPANFKKEFDRLKSNTTYRYLNSGVIVGYKSAIMEILEAMDAPNLPVDYHDNRSGKNFHFNDQAYFMDIYLRQPIEIKLDHDCSIVQNMQDVSEDEITLLEGGYIQNKETKYYPSIIHWNGSSKDKWSREPILKHLNLL